MMSTVVRIALLAELAAWIALGVAAGPGGPWAAMGIAAACLVGACLVRLAIVLVAFGLAERTHSPREPGQRLGPAGTVRLVAGEWRTMLVNNFWWLPFCHVALRPDPPLAPSARTPLIVVHGYVSNRGTVAALVRALDRADVGPVYAPSLPKILEPIGEFADCLDRVIDEVIAGTGQRRVILVCHSMGGLVARSVLASRGRARIACLVTLGSPHHGSSLAAFGLGRNLRQMRPGSAFLRELGRAEGESGPGVPALSVYTTHDNLVSPQASSRLPWARHAVLSGVGHVALLADPRAHAAVVDGLRAIAAEAAAA